ncbi:MAG: c-type cytochrome, partial [Rubrivivax sp.]
MNTWIKRGALALGILIGAAALASTAGLLISEHKMARQIAVKAHPIDWNVDATALERGRYLFNSRGCAECHGADGSGKVFIQEANGMLVKSPNISPG